MSDLNSLVVIAGGGTAGHVLPALAVAQELCDEGYQKSQILFMGSSRGQEATLVPRAGFEVKLLPGRGLVRRIGVSELTLNLRSATGLAAALVRSISLMRKARPSVVLAVGGYASLPPALAAAILRVPLVVLNVDSVPGGSNRFVARFASVCAVAWPGTNLPKTVVTGTPLRKELAEAQTSLEAKNLAKDELAVGRDKTLVVVTGGSLGAARLNEAAFRLARLWSNKSDRVLWHVVGRRDWGKYASTAASSAQLDYRTVEYEERMATLFTAADVIVSRAGAGTVAELAALGRPSILVPLPNAPSDHQNANASILERVGAAIVLADHRCDGEKLAETLDELLGKPQELARMAMAAASVGSRDGAYRVAKLLDDTIKGRSHG